MEEVTGVVVDYKNMLEEFKVPFIKRSEYLLVGEIPVQSGWLLELSVIPNQFHHFMELLLPMLIDVECCFQIPENANYAFAIIRGRHGNERLGRVIVVYPVNDDVAVVLAKKLIEYTRVFRGADIPGASYLGGTVYTRYGSFNTEKVSLPFSIPGGVYWPFSEINTPIIIARNRILNKTYRPVEVLKSNLKGDAIKAVYYKNIFKMGHCFIKQGRRNTFVDDKGRDVCDRLLWQYHVHKALEGTVKLPKVIDFFEEGHDTYLVMQLIKGETLTRVINGAFNSLPWTAMNRETKLILLDLLLQVIQELNNMHRKGFLHRDLSCENFLVVNNSIYLIDVELAYEISANKPDPPFEWGTIGFRSLDWEEFKQPVWQDDIYGLGALMVIFFLNLPPATLDFTNLVRLKKCIQFFTGNDVIAQLIADCVSADVENRPTLESIRLNIEGIKAGLFVQYVTEMKPPEMSGSFDVSYYLKKAVSYFCSEYVIESDKIWLSILPRSSQSDLLYQVSPGFSEGISGILYLISLLKNENVDITELMPYYFRNLSYLDKIFFSKMDFYAPGLYEGKAGFSIAIASGIKYRLLEDNERNRSLIRRCLETDTINLDVASGAAGIGLAILYCFDYLDECVRAKLAGNIAFLIVNGQSEDGSWLVRITEDGKEGRITGFSYGVAGIAYFLWKYLSFFKDEKVLESAKKAMKYIESISFLYNKRLLWPVHANAKEFDLFWSVGICGVIYSYLTAYEYTNDTHFRVIAEKALAGMVTYMHGDCLLFENGASGLGELFLEAWRVLGDDEYKKRADLILYQLLYLSKEEQKYIFWPFNKPNYPGVTLFNGNGGIVHFLMKYCNRNMAVLPVPI